ncbi:MAG: IclR family transcriptional regulator [Betaproteobacteria bacterium]|nr:IclR family transcriptional regulator [Betaproteobacteria bacterium]
MTAAKRRRKIRANTAPASRRATARVPEPDLAEPAQPLIKSLSTALRLLSRFVATQGPLGVGELAQQIGLHKSQVSKILKTFRHYDFLEQDAGTQEYSVGLNTFALGNNYVNAFPLSRDALPVMRKLVDATGHSAVLSIMRGSNVIHLLAVEGRLFIDGRWRVGRWMPYHATAAGKLLLAFGPAEKIDLLLKTRGLPRITPNTITNQRRFRAALRKARTTGISVTRSETYAGTAAIAAPVFEASGQAIATLGLICPEHLLTRDEEERLVAPLQRAARELSFRMGAETYRFGK